MNNVITHKTKEIIVKGKTVKISFSDKKVPGSIEEVKRILISSYLKSQVCEE